MNTYQFYTLGKKGTARIKVDKLSADFEEKEKQADFNRVSVYGLGDWLYNNLTTASINHLVGHIVKRYKESENASEHKR